MPSITLKDIPPTLHRALKSRAALHHRSLNQEAIAILTEAAAPVGKIDVEALIEDARRFRESIHLAVPLKELLEYKREGLE